MLLKTLALTNFKNIASASLEFSPKINCLLGNNGMGKSNLLDAIHFLSFANIRECSKTTEQGNTTGRKMILEGTNFWAVSEK